MSDSVPSTSAVPSVEKVKKTRRRQRVSCVECTKRRQKCDRQYPCGLCVSRGVSHLCRWESGPVARPVPARPPDQPSPQELLATIRTLSERIASLERSAAGQTPPGPPTGSNLESSEHHSSSATAAAGHAGSSAHADPSSIAPSTNQWSNDSEGYEASPPAPLQKDVHEAAVTLAQLSLAHHGEYVGNNTVVCTLHHLGAATLPFRYSKSTESTSINNETPLSFSLNPVQALVRAIPPKVHTDKLVALFFTECNWRYGILETWFRAAYSRMWHALESRGVEQVNANWLSLFFAVLALVPRDGADLLADTSMISPETCFLHAIAARRVAEDAFFSAPSFSSGNSAMEGAVLGCIAAVLLGGYLADRGSVSESWKLVGGAIRAAQAAGMHRDPDWTKWEAMNADERLLRRRGWWALVIWDRLYSYVLGRPTMIHGDISDVPPPSSKRLDGTQDAYDTYHGLVEKLSEIVGDTDQKSPSLPYATVLAMDRRYEEWLAQLPTVYRWYDPPEKVSTVATCRTVNRQRHTLAVWYLACRMNLHRPWLARVKLPAPSSQFGLPDSQNVVVKSSRERCISLAIELVRMQSAVRCKASGHALWTHENMDFGRLFFVFDGAVTLITAMAYAPEHPRKEECLKLVEEAIEILETAAKSSRKREIAERALAVLRVLKKAFERTDALSHPGMEGRDSSLAVEPSVVHGLSVLFSAHLASLNSNTDFSGSPAAPLHIADNHFPSPYFNSDTFDNMSVPQGYDGIANGEATWTDQSIMNWVNDANIDVHAMMSFDLLQGLPLDEDRQWRGL